MTRGFTLLEVVIALLVVELAVVGVVGMLVLASSTLTSADGLERAVAVAEGALDSLQRESGAGSGVRSYEGGELLWSVDDSANVVLTAVTAARDTLLVLRSVLPRP